MGKHSANAIWGGLFSGLKTSSGLISAIFAVKLLGSEDYGEIATVLAIFVLYLGLNNSIFSILVAKIYALAPLEQDNNKLFSASLLLTIGSICVLWTLTAVCSYFTPILFPNTPNAYTYLVLFIMTLLTSIQVLTGFFSALIEGSGRLDLSLRRQTFGPLFVSFSLVTLYCIGFNISSYAYLVILVSGASVDLIAVHNLYQKIYTSGIPFSCSSETLNNASRLLKSGSLIQAGTVMSIFLEPLNKLLLNSFSGPVLVTAYDLSMKLIWGIQSLFAGGMRVFLHQADEDSLIVNRNYNHTIRIILVPVIASHILAVLLLALLAHYWINVGSYLPIMQFFGLATISNLGMIFVNPAYVSLISRGDYGFILRSQTIVAVVNLVASFLLIPSIGLIGSSIGLLLATVINAILIYKRYSHLLGSSPNLSDVAIKISVKLTFSIFLFLLSLGIGTFDVINFKLLSFVVFSVLLILKDEPIVSIFLSNPWKAR